MTPVDWLVLGGGIAAIAWVNWYFFVAGNSQETDVSGGDQAENRRST